MPRKNNRCKEMRFRNAKLKRSRGYFKCGNPIKEICPKCGTGLCNGHFAITVISTAFINNPEKFNNYHPHDCKNTLLVQSVNKEIKFGSSATVWRDGD